MISYYVIAKVLHIAQRISAFLFGIDSQKNKGVEQYLHRNACHCMRVDFAENGRVFTDVIQPEAPPPPPSHSGSCSRTSCETRDQLMGLLSRYKSSPRCLLIHLKNGLMSALRLLQLFELEPQKTPENTRQPVTIIR